MRQHLSKTNQSLREGQRGFLIGFYGTSICSSTVYQCNTCLIRFTGKGKHLKLCRKPAIVRVKATCTTDFSESLNDASIWNANSGTGRATSLLEEYNNNREEGGDPELTRFQRNFSTAILRGTQFFREPLKIQGALGQIQKKYTYQTMRKLMFELLRMVDFLKAYKAKEPRIKGPLVEGTIRTLLRKAAKKPPKKLTKEVSRSSAMSRVCTRWPICEKMSWGCWTSSVTLVSIVTSTYAWCSLSFIPNQTVGLGLC